MIVPVHGMEEREKNHAKGLPDGSPRNRAEAGVHWLHAAPLWSPDSPDVGCSVGYLVAGSAPSKLNLERFWAGFDQLAFPLAAVASSLCSMQPSRALTLGHSPDPDDAFMFFGLAKERIPTFGFQFEHILQDIQTLNERATGGELDISAISIHAYAYVCDQYALLPTGASMGDGYGPMLVAKERHTKEAVSRLRIAVPGTMTSAFLALQLWLGKPARDFHHVVVPFDQIFQAVRSGAADVGLIIHEGQLTYQNEGLAICEDLGIWWGRENEGLPLPLGGNVVHKRFPPETRRLISSILTA